MPQKTLYVAQWVLPVSDPPIAEGALLVEGSTIAQVGRARDLRLLPVDETRYLTGHLILPGLINVHTHLELSFLKGRLKPGSSFVQWIEQLVGELLQTPEEMREESVRAGIKEALASGTTALGDISRSGASLRLLAQAGLKGVVFLEVLGLHPAQEEEALQRAKIFLESIGRPRGPVTSGLAPHAPYSTSASLYGRASSLGQDLGLPMALHVAETLEEELFVREGRGPIRELLERFGLWDETIPIPRCSPVAYLDGLGVLQGALAIHCNTVNDEDIRTLQRAEARVAVCPGSNAWFGRTARHPLPRLLDAGIRCALGTDSLASNHSLDLLTEMGLLASSHPELRPETILRLATLDGAHILGLSHLCGSLEPGKAADLVALRLPESPVKDPTEWVVAEATGQSVDLVVVNGQEAPWRPRAEG